MSTSMQNRMVGMLLRIGGRNAPFRSAAQLRQSLSAAPDKLSQPDPPSKLRQDTVVFESLVFDDVNGAWPVFRIEPRDGEARATVIFLHGGAHVRQANRLHWQLVSALVTKANVRVIFPKFPLAPAASANTTVPVVTDLVAATLEQYSPMGPVRVMGDSAGGGLAMAALLLLRDSGARMPDGVLLISPWLDVTMSDPSQPIVAEKDPILAIPGLAEAGRLWAGELSTSDPRVSPLYGDFHGFPPVLVMCGTYDLLVADARRFVDDARAADVPITYIEQPELFHDYALLPTPEGGAARAEILSWAARH
jgi:epsilon-lactone hydrolase